jgi:ABC-type transport system involved in Fe-S cluster assembly fused permease/ATPase subunit
VKLSNKETLQLAIARAILKNPTIVLVDSVPSAVGTEPDHDLRQALSTLCKGRTTFITAYVPYPITTYEQIVN